MSRFRHQISGHDLTPSAVGLYVPVTVGGVLIAASFPPFLPDGHSPIAFPAAVAHGFFVSCARYTFHCRVGGSGTLSERSYTTSIGEMSMFAPFRRAPLAGLAAHGLFGKPSAELPSFEAASFSRRATPRPSRPCPRTVPSKLNASALSLSPIGKTTRLSKTVSPSAFPDTPASKSSPSRFLACPEAYGHEHAREDSLPVPDGRGRLPPSWARVPHPTPPP